MTKAQQIRASMQAEPTPGIKKSEQIRAELQPQPKQVNSHAGVSKQVHDKNEKEQQRTTTLESAVNKQIEYDNSNLMKSPTVRAANAYSVPYGQAKGSDYLAVKNAEENAITPSEKMFYGQLKERVAEDLKDNLKVEKHSVDDLYNAQDRANRDYKRMLESPENEKYKKWFDDSYDTYANIEAYRELNPEPVVDQLGIMGSNAKTTMANFLEGMARTGSFGPEYMKASAEALQQNMYKRLQHDHGPEAKVNDYFNDDAGVFTDMRKAQEEMLQRRVEDFNRRYNPQGIGKFGLDALNVVSAQAPNLLLTALDPTTGFYSMYETAGNQTYNQKRAEGATIEQAQLSKVASGGAEVATEMMFGSTVDKALGRASLLSPSQYTSMIGNKYLRGAANVLFDVAGEGGEEVASYLINELADATIYNHPLNISEEEAWENFSGSILPTLILTGSSNVIQGINTYANKATNKINQSQLTDVQKSELINKIENGKKELLNQVEQRKAEIDNVASQKSNEIDTTIPQNSNVTASQDVAQTPTQITQNNVENTTETPAERIRRETANTQQTATENSIINKVAELNKLGYNIPTETANTLQAIQDVRGVRIEFDNTIDGNGVYDAKNRIVYLNPNSTRAIEFTIAHELGHDIKAGNLQDYNKLQKAVLDYAEKQKNFGISKQALDNTYKSKLGEGNYDINDEMTNDILGEVLGNQEFLDSLAQEQPNLFQKVWNWIKNVLIDNTNGRLTFNERRLLNKYEQGFRNAYQKAFNGVQQEGLQQSLSENRKPKQFKKDIERKFEELTGDSILKAGARLAGIELRNRARENGNFVSPINGKELYGGREMEQNPYSEEAMKLYNQYQNSQKSSSYLYHATGTDRLESIIKNGITTGNKQNQEGVSSSKEIYLSATPELAESFAPNDSVTLRINPRFYDKFENFKDDWLGGEGSYSITNNIPPEMLQIKENGKWIPLLKSNQAKQLQNNTQYSLSEAPTQDNQGRQLSEGQQNYFRDSKARDENGNLLEVYHGTSNDFTKFDRSYLGTASSDVGFLGDGFYLATHKGEAGYYGSKVMSGYVNITNPYSINELSKYKGKAIKGENTVIGVEIYNLVNMNPQWRNVEIDGNTYGEIADETQKYLDNVKIKKLGNVEDYSGNVTGVMWGIDYNGRHTEQESIPEYTLEEMTADSLNKHIRDNFGYLDSHDVIQNITYESMENSDIKSFSQILQERGYDSIIQNTPQTTDEIVIFNSNQFKNTDNLNPTDNEDIRYQKSNPSWQQFLEDTYGKWNTGTRTNFEQLPSNEELQQVERDGVANEPIARYSLSEEQQNEVNDYINKLTNDTTIDDNFKDQILTRFDNLTDYKQFENIKQDVEDYKEKAYQGIKSLVDVANMKPEDVEQRPMEYTQRKDKNTANQRKFFDNAETSNIIAEETKNRVNPTTYEKQSNLDTLEEVRQKLDERGNDMVEEWKHKTKNYTAKDVALGAILIERYQQNGDWQSAARTVEKLADMGTEAGRAVQMYSIFQRLSPETMAIYQQKALDNAFEEMKQRKTGKWVEANKDKFKLTAEDTKFIYEQVEKASQAIDDETKQRELSKIENRINEKLPPEAGQSIKALRRIAMLFNPKTQVRNFMGNLIIAPVNDVADFIGSKIDKAIAKKTGVRTTNNPNLITKAKGFKKGIKDAITDYKTGTRTTASGSKYEFDIGAKAFNENTGNKVRDAVNTKLNKINDLLSSVMSGGDRPFYEAAFQNSLEGQMKANNVTEPTQEMIDIAVNEALQRTWNDDNNYTKAVLGIRRAMNHINIKGFGLGDLIIPFAKTPANLTKAIVEYSPAGFIESVIDFNDMRKAISRGEMTPMQQKRFVTSMSKAITGSFLYLIASMLAKSGRITGSADDDKDVKNFEQNVLGIQPYSVRIGDKSYTYSWANPLNAPLAIMADTYKMSKENASKWEMLNNAFKVAGETLVENSFMSGIKELFSKDSISEGLVDAVESFPESLVPTFLSQIASLNDPTQRQTFEYQNDFGTVTNKIKNKLPGARNTLAPQVNTFGEEIENQNTALNAFLNPANVREARTTDSQKALYDVYQETKDKTIFPMQAPYYVSDNGEKRNLSSKDRVTYQKASGQYVTEVYDGLFNQDAFNEAYHVGKEGKVEILKEIASDGNTKGKEAIGVTTKNTDSLNEKIDTLNDADIPLADYYILWYSQKNQKGKQAKKTALSQTIDYINEGDHQLTKEQKEVLYGIFNVN